MEYISKHDSPTFHFIDGPPFVSSETLHYGHILVSCVKSAILHYKYMNGFAIQNTIGYDCHGLPIEMRINDALQLKTTKDVIDYGIAEYNQVCKDFVKRCESSWIPIYKTIGRVVNETDSYRTLDEGFMRTVWTVFHDLWTAGYITNGYRVVPYSLACGTSLSNFEASQNYKDVTDTSLYWSFPFESANIIVWTTTPWTLPANHAVCVNKSLSYSLVQTNTSQQFWIATSRIAAFEKIAKPLTPFIIIATVSGSYFAGKEYTGFVNEQKKIIADDYVSDDSGTGFVHIAPEFGEDDLRVVQQNKIPVKYGYINDDGIVQWGPYANEFVLNTSKNIMRDYKSHIIAKEQYKHSYPYCWRTDTPLIYRAMNSFFVSVKEVRDKLVEYNKSVQWLPEHVGTRRFHDWLQNARDWGISRNRVFGTPIPIWTNGDEFICLDESQFVGDLHRDKIDDYTFEKNGKTFRRVPDVFDCWFESGCVPFVVGGQAADLIVEGLDQTRGWFYTLMVLWGLLKKEAPYKAVVTCGLILAEDGKKMSKRLNNYRNVMDVVSEYGADSLRMYLINSPASCGEAVKFSEKDMTKQMRRLIPYKNAGVFWLENGMGRKDFTIEHTMDKWILNELNTLITDVTNAMEVYDVRSATDSLLVFVDKLCNKYLRIQRTHIRQHGSGILWNVVRIFTQLLTPFVPFMAEEVWHMLGCKGHPLQCEWPTLEGHTYTTEVTYMFELIDKVRMMRDKDRFPFKKPIQYLYVNVPQFTDDLLEAFQTEVNVMDIVWNATHVYYEHNDTPEVLTNYTLRQINREICNTRKSWGLKQFDKTTYTFVIEEKYMKFFEDNREYIETHLGIVAYDTSGRPCLGDINISLDLFKASFTLYQ